MHETALVRSLLTQVRELAHAQGGGAVREIHVQCGQLSGVDPELVRLAFQRLRCDGGCGSAELVLEDVALAARCRVCKSEFSPLGFSFRCPGCASTSVDVVRGEGFILESIVVAADDAEQAR